MRHTASSAKGGTVGQFIFQEMSGRAVKEHFYQSR
jgi:hypothetical protein